MSKDASRIFEHLREHGPTRATELADVLGIDRSTVNRVLYGELRGKVRQGTDYRWSAGTVQSAVPRKTESVPNVRAGLFRYYLDCLSRDDDSGVEAFADSKYDLDYVELPSWPLETDEADLSSDALRKLVGRQRRESRKKTLWLGYPTLVRQAQSRTGWRGAFVEPLLLWPQDPDGTKLAFLLEPKINTRALRSLGASESVLEEAAHLTEELGLDASELPPLDEIIARLRDVRPEWDWKDGLVPAPLRGIGELRQIEQTGIYNAAIVVIADRSPYTVGLESEMADLCSVADGGLEETSLGMLLGARGITTDTEAPLLEPAPLNAEQRTAVRQALHDPLTVITGPPGTGKSQVVIGIVVNAAWRGLRVLFASKNNKAVDVVMDRLNALSARPVMLRLGSRALQEQLAQYITAILSSQPTEDDRQAYQHSLSELEERNRLISRANHFIAEVIALRNRVDRLEREAEVARSVLPADLFVNAAKVRTADLERAISATRNVLLRADREHATFLDRLLWIFLAKSREKAAKASVEGVRALFEDVGVPISVEDGTQLLDRGEEVLTAIASATRYREALSDLSTHNDIGALSREVAKLTSHLAEISEEAWSSWTALLPDRLSPNDRRALGDYAALLRSISTVNEEGGTIDRKIWARYYALAAKTTKALPCWAVTSLSARGRIPFTPAQFDVVVVDEASQCDIASALPLLYRAKRAVVIGDPQQLRHISQLSEQQDQALMVKYALLDDPGPNWSYRASSLYDLASARAPSGSIVALRDHHRSHAAIIGFSNEFFYGGKLRVATDYRRLVRPDGPAIRWVNVVGSVVRPAGGGAINRPEAEAVVAELRRLAISQRYAGEIGVVTPFRAQANLIEELIVRDESLAPVLAARNFISETAHRFQGDERDLIVFSPVVSSHTPAGALGFLRGQGNIFNVGITRARGALVVVGDAASCTACDVPHLRAFTRYVLESNQAEDRRPSAFEVRQLGRDFPPVARPELVSDWERVFYSALSDAGIRAIPQYDVDQYILDFAIVRPSGRRLDIEIDGERYHRDWDGELLKRDQLRNLRLIEMGWDVIRLWVYQVRDDLPACIDRIRQWIAAADGVPEVLHGEKAGDVEPLTTLPHRPSEHPTGEQQPDVSSSLDNRRHSADTGF